MKLLIKKNNKKGASLVEYALLIALIAVACMAAMGALKTNISQSFSKTGSALL